MAENKEKAFDGAELTSFDILTPNDESRELLLDPNRLSFVSLCPRMDWSSKERVVIPEALQADITQRIHSTHIGTEGCLRRARDCVYWHGMNDHIKKYVATCDICRSVDAKQQKETLKPHEPTTRPWTKDYLPDTKSSTVIRKLKAHFARQGIPNIVFSDNGPQYSSTEFANFSRKWEFRHHTSSPGYPQSKAESAVKIAKRLMKKAKLAGQDPYLALLDHRNTPTQGLTTSPAQRLLSRRTRTLLPIGDRLLQPKVTDNKLALMKNRERQTKYYNRTAKDMDTLNPGDLVRVQPFEPHTLWTKARVCNTLGNRSYDVELDNGRVLRRNRRHLRRAEEVKNDMSTHLQPEGQNIAVPTQNKEDTQNNTTRTGRVVL
ncbi:solute carrier family 39 (zinc transporter), member 14 [Sarotherodon galilaeus]